MSTLLRSGLLAAAMACVAVPATAPAAGARLAIAPVKDDAGGAVARQLEAALCGVRECLPGALAGPRLDLARARQLGAAGSLVASVWQEKQGKVLSAALFTTGATPVRRWKLPLGRDGRLGQASLDQLAREVAAVLPPTGPRQAPPAAAAPRPAPQVPAPAPARL